MYAITSLDHYREVVEMEDSLVNIYFHASWCETCVEMKPLYEELNGDWDIPFYSVDIDALPEVKEFAKIKAIPMLYIFSNGRVREFVYGKSTKQDINKKIHRTVNVQRT